MSARYAFGFAAFAAVALGVATARAGDGPLVEVPLDVDVYADPGGVGKPVAMIRGKRPPPERRRSLVPVYGPKVPGGKGWIWCGKGDDGQDYSVKPVAGGVEEKPAVEVVCPQGQAIVQSGTVTICRGEISAGVFACSKASVKDGKLSYEPIACPET